MHSTFFKLVSILKLKLRNNPLEHLKIKIHKKGISNKNTISAVVKSRSEITLLSLTFVKYHNFRSHYLSWPNNLETFKNRFNFIT